jgi:predicted negative regulator of RcsB-dependent stress response
MGKAFAGFVRLLVVLGLLGLVAYNTWQISQLRAEIDVLKRRPAVSSASAARHGSESRAAHREAAEEPEAETNGSGALGTLSAAQQHVEAARAALALKDYAEASRQMTMAAQAAQKAAADVRSGGEDRLAAFKHAVSGLQTQVDRMLDQDHSAAGDAH